MAARGAAREPRALLRLAFGYTREDLDILVGPLARTGKEPTGSMGDDAALAALSQRSPPLFAYFRQLFAQVTNPAIDPLREERRDEPRDRARPARRTARRGAPPAERRSADGAGPPDAGAARA